MKKLLLVVVCLFLTYSVSAQSSFREGDMILDLGIGLNNQFFSNPYYSTTLAPISVDFEYSIVDKLVDGKGAIGIGAFVGMASKKTDGWYDYWGRHYGNVKRNDFFFGVKGNFHLQFVDKLDTYAGVVIGYDNVSGNHGYWGDDDELFVGFYLGARYYVSRRVALMGELGHFISVFKLGITVKL